MLLHLLGTQARQAAPRLTPFGNRGADTHQRSEFVSTGMSIYAWLYGDRRQDRLLQTNESVEPEPVIEASSAQSSTEISIRSNLMGLALTVRKGFER